MKDLVVEGGGRHGQHGQGMRVYLDCSKRGARGAVDSNEEGVRLRAE
jgi:hypothetical protein